jgi:hypothetical protein
MLKLDDRNLTEGEAIMANPSWVARRKETRCRI